MFTLATTANQRKQNLKTNPGFLQLAYGISDLTCSKWVNKKQNNNNKKKCKSAIVTDPAYIKNKRKYLKHFCPPNFNKLGKVLVILAIKTERGEVEKSSQL